MMISSSRDPSSVKGTSRLVVEQVQYLYVRVVKARNLPAKDVTGSCDPYAEVRLGNYKGITRHFEKNANPEWNQVFAFSRDKIQASVLEVTVKDKDLVKDDFMGLVLFDLTEVPKRVPPDSSLAAEWFVLKDRKGERSKGELMLAVWWGTQADDAFLEAASVGAPDGLPHTRSKVYLAPTLWYLRVGVIEMLDLVPIDISTEVREVAVKATLGHQTWRTHISKSRSMNPIWNEELIFVAAEPFEELLKLSVTYMAAPDRHEVLGTCAIDLLSVERRLDDKAINTRWIDLEKAVVEGEKKEIKFASMIHTRICLEGGYHVLDESISNSSDLRPTAKELWKESVGTLELGILDASGLLPMKTKDGRETTDAFCVAKYGRKWARTTTITNSFSPKWNEQFTWAVYDPCTVITIGIFDNGLLQSGKTRDARIGKVRIRISTLRTDCLYTDSYPLLALHPLGLKKMGEIHLAVKFTCSSFLNMMHSYSQPLLPKMHYIHPLTVSHLDFLRHHATRILSMHLSKDEQLPLRKEVVEYMLDAGSDVWSMRRTKANILRIKSVVGGLIPVLKWFDDIRNWKNPIATILVHILFVILVLYPEFILPLVFLYPFLHGVWYYKWKPENLPHIDTRLSYAENASLDDLDEEFDTFPTSRTHDIVRKRYDHFRSISGRIQTVIGDLATEGERLQSLLSWRDPRATALFLIFCLIAAIVVYAKPCYVVVIQIGFTLLSHPRFQHNLPLVPFNFFKRLPTKNDCIL